MAFETNHVFPGVTHIRDAMGVCMTLLEGSQAALLVDTGYGTEDVAAFVRTLTDKAYELSKRCRTPENRFIARAIYCEIKEEQERLYRMAFNYKAAEKEN